MAGHSKWAGIKHKKAVVDARRGKLWAKLSRQVEVAARDAGTANPDNDMTLAAAWERAKQGRMPADTIERAAKRGAGELDGDIVYERVLYEGYGPGGVALLVETLTENRNRTSAEVRSAFTRNGGNVAEPNAVAWMFNRRGLFVVTGSSEDDVLMAAADAGAEDITIVEDDKIEVVCEVPNYGAVRDALIAAGIEVESSDLTMLPQTTIEIDVDKARSVLKLMDILDELDDTQNVYANLDIPDEVLAEVG